MPSRQLLSLSPAAPPRHHHHHSHRVLPPLAAATASLSLLLFIALLYRKLTRNRTAPAPPSDSDNKHSPPPPLRRFSFGALRRCTGSFSVSSRLGQGGFGSVFRGVLNGGAVAVKVMETAGSIQGEREFHNELNLASRIAAANAAADVAVSLSSRFLVSILGYSSDRRGHRKVIVYELMANGSLQEKLLDQKCRDLVLWAKRFGIVLDVARALEYLHFDCGSTPVVHGDVKPSNVLLDEDFNAKLGDFGLARVLEENNEELQSENVLIEVEDDEKLDEDCRSKVRIEENGSIIVDSESMTTGFDVEASPETGTGTFPAVEVSPAPSETVLERGSLQDSESESTRKIGRKKSGSFRDWWWKQDNVVGSESGRVKDYVMEWIGSEIKKERPKSEWVIGGSSSNHAGSLREKIEPKKHRKRLDWWASLDETKLWKKDKGRKPREWWKEEFCDELTKKKKNKKKKGAKSSSGGDLWWQRDEDFIPPERKKRKKRSSFGSIDWWLDGLSGELRGGGLGRRNSQDWEIQKSGGISSTPSMRGTVCYIAPEYNGGGQITEKCDVYSFGVLVLVVISGRRPLQVTASPMSEFERANLISWARQLAYNGKLLDLVDSSIQALDKEKAMLCITIALLCLQRSPSKRPNMKEIVKMLTGEAELPALPFEFSPSPPSNFPFRSRKKCR